jgi:hypothetical protein
VATYFPVASVTGDTIFEIFVFFAYLFLPSPLQLNQNQGIIIYYYYYPFVDNLCILLFGDRQEQAVVTTCSHYTKQKPTFHIY